MYAGAKHKHLPQYLSFVHPRFATPSWAIISFSVIAFLVAVSGGFKQLAVLATGTMIVLYIGVVCSVIKLRMQKKSIEPGFRLPGGFTIPVLALIALCWFLFQLKKIELTGIAIFIAVISIIYFVKNRYKKIAAE
jgi:amino acid transporter